MPRKPTRTVLVGGVPIGGGAPIPVQSMTNTDTRDSAATLRQIQALRRAGCDIVRVSVYDQDCVAALPAILRGAGIPVVADIHFDHRLAIAAMECGVQKVRINPGNVGGPDKVRELVACARERAVPIRIGVNSGSVEPRILARDGGVTAKGLWESAQAHIRLLEDCGFHDIIVAVKASTVPMMVEAYRLAAAACRYPLHLGVTEAGGRDAGLIKSAAGIGSLLLDGIGDTIRVSLTGDPVQEVRAGRLLLRSLGLLNEGVDVVSCPTCGRCNIDVEGVARFIEERTSHIRAPLRVAVMGCVVNGPGEAREADVGLAGGKGKGVLFARGERIATVEEADMAQALLAEVERLAAQKEKSFDANP